MPAANLSLLSNYARRLCSIPRPPAQHQPAAIHCWPLLTVLFFPPPTSQCFYTPKCHRDRNDLLNSARDIKEFFDHRNGTFTCFYSPDGQMGVVLRKSGHKVVFHCLLWPLLTLLGGALIVGLVRLTQHLSLQCEQYSTVLRVQARGRAPSVGRRRAPLCSVAQSLGRKRELRRRPQLSHPERLQLKT